MSEEPKEEPKEDTKLDPVDDFENYPEPFDDIEGRPTDY